MKKVLKTLIVGAMTTTLLASSFVLPVSAAKASASNVMRHPAVVGAILGDYDSRKPVEGEGDKRVCYIRVRSATTDSNGNRKVSYRWIGTAWVFADKALMTASHCAGHIFDENAECIEVFPGINLSDTSKYSSADLSNHYDMYEVYNIRRTYEKDGKNYDDWAVLETDTTINGKTIGQNCGYFEFTDDLKVTDIITITGYHQDKPMYQQFTDTRAPENNNNNDLIITDYYVRSDTYHKYPKVKYYLDTIGGASGSPVYKTVNGVDYAVAVHDAGSSNIKNGVETGYNCGRKIDGDLKWIMSTYRDDSNKRSIDTLSINITDNSHCFDGKAQIPSAVEIKDGDRLLTKDQDYKITYSNNYGAGTATMTITGIGWYCGSYTYNYTIRQRPIQSFSISTVDSVIYNGRAQSPRVIVKDYYGTLTNGVDYTVAYTNNTNVGTATYTVTGKGNYSGTVTGTFNITKASIKNCKFTVADTSVYNGSAQRPELVVKYRNNKLTLNKDYTVSYQDNVNAGQGTIVIIGKGNFSGSVYQYFTIKRRNVSNLKIECASYVKYTGKARVPKIVVKDGTKVLEKNKDYEIYLSNNKNAGTATISVYGKGNYVGKKFGYFRITYIGTKVLMGDVDGDGSVTITDVTTLQRYIADIITLSGKQLSAADVDLDGNVDISDVTALQRYVADIAPLKRTRVLIGDVDQDGKITIKDVTLAQKYVSAMTSLRTSQIIAADVDQDGSVDIQDVTNLQRYLAQV